MTAAECDALPIRATRRNLSVFKIATESAESELTVGTHHANVCVGSNAPLRPLVAVPVTPHHVRQSRRGIDDSGCAHYQKYSTAPCSFYRFLPNVLGRAFSKPNYPGPFHPAAGAVR